MLFAGVAALAPAPMQAGQQPDSPAPQALRISHARTSEATTTASQGTPVSLNLQDALNLAKRNSAQWQSAVTDAGVAREDANIARGGLLPNVNFNTGAIITQTNSPGTPAFIANNGAHEYISQGNVHQQLDISTLAAYRSKAAAAAAAKAHQEVALRGLVVTVVQNYFAVATAEQKLAAARRTAEEGNSFLQLTQSLEKGGEVAHADEIKAELQMQERRRQLQEAQLALVNARLDLAVLIFPDFNDNFLITDDLHANVALPTREA